MMCGIVAAFGKYTKNDVINWTKTIKHRGPDDTQYYFSKFFGCGFVRLSIIDIEGGQQPITNEDGSLILICNGEIYNHKELYNMLFSKHKFKTKSDVEVILHLYEDYGLKCIDKLQGMYAFIIYDTIKNEVVAGRDHIGIKPLFYKKTKNTLIFTSELKIFNLNHINKNKKALIEKEVFGFNLDTGTTIYNNIYSVDIASAILINNKFEITLYKANYNYKDESVEDALMHSVERHLVNADVEVGIALSGGLDSSLIAVLCKEVQPHIKTFVISNTKNSEDVYYAKLMAKKYDFDHTEFIIKYNRINNLNYYLDSILNYDRSGAFDNIGDEAVFLFYKEIKNYVKVILSGDGGDELFGGYWMHKKPLGFKDKLLKRTRDRQLRSYLEKLFPETDEVTGKKNVYDILFKSALPNYHLWTLDRCSMHFGVEARVPYLDGAVVAATLKKNIDARIGKRLLNKLYYKYLPTEIIDRNKKGFCDALKN